MGIEMVTMALTGLVLAAPSILVFGGGRDKQPPDERALQAQVWDRLSAILHLREQGAAAGASIAAHDESLARIIETAPSLLAQPQASLVTLDSLTELLKPALMGQLSEEEGRRVRQNVEELLLLSHGLPTPETRQAVEPLRGWHSRLQALPPLKGLGPANEATARMLQMGDYVFADGALYEAASIDRYYEAYMGSTWEWFEASLVRTSDFGKSSLSWEVDDGLEFSMPIATPTLAELGLTTRRAREIIEEEEGRVSWQGRTFEVEDGGTALFYRGQGATGEEFDYASLAEPGGLWMDIEDWGDEVEAFVSKTVASQGVAFLRGQR